MQTTSQTTTFTRLTAAATAYLRDNGLLGSPLATTALDRLKRNGPAICADLEHNDMTSEHHIDNLAMRLIDEAYSAYGEVRGDY